MAKLVTIAPALCTFKTFTSQKRFTVEGQVEVFRDDMGELAVNNIFATLNSEHANRFGFWVSL